jgi:chromosome segregation ATPase
VESFDEVLRSCKLEAASQAKQQTDSLKADVVRALRISQQLTHQATKLRAKVTEQTMEVNQLHLRVSEMGEQLCTRDIEVQALRDEIGALREQGQKGDDLEALQKKWFAQNFVSEPSI